MTKRKYDYILRTCEADLTSMGNFKWPEKGHVEAPDGGELHGFLNGAGYGALADWSPEAKWLVVRIPKGEYVDLDGYMVKFPRGDVIFCGSQFDATNFIARFVPEGTAIIGRTFEGKNAVVGYKGTATTGDFGTAIAGIRGTASAGAWGTASAGRYGRVSAGEKGIIEIGYYDDKKRRWRKKTGYIGEDGLRPNIKYRLDKSNNFVEAEQKMKKNN